MQFETLASLQALNEIVQDLWYDKLTIVSDLWLHGERWGWAMEALHDHVYWLSSGLSTTKFTLEEVLASLADRGRDAKHNVWNIYRIYGGHGYCRRMMESCFGNGFVKLQHGDARVADAGLCKPSYFGSDMKQATGTVLQNASKMLPFLLNLKLAPSAWVLIYIVT